MIPKFRAWDKFEKEMLNVHGINYDADGVWTKEVFDEEDTGDFIHFSDIELLQSTGLKDINGTEIFEGDIIDKGYSNIDIVDRIGYVKFGTGDDSDGYLNQEWLGWTTNNDDSLLDVHEHCTVLGNKFEHPHLLGEE
ncbi:YopX family protein [Mammaliicoccus sciuri]|uniref:YopX family protein n=1 Tax=Mammaliicoccus sciuri TaxID=1296 RepID=UPI00265BA4EA|nr:YopX family protein [Mammaliicoccus sciuri]MDO0948207.1 YopX family protein [Mammaliicoccus sciuri]